jgi:putative phage-type endonuclease
MKINLVEQKTKEWFKARLGLVTGTGLKSVVGTPKARQTYFWEILAERLTVDDGSDETPMQRGNRLEEEARLAFEEETGKKVDVAGLCVNDENPYIGYSPDGLIKKGKKYTEDIEIKCPTSGKHVMYWQENKIPEEYYEQIVQAFIVNPDLKTRYFVSYDPRIAIKPLWIKEINRNDVIDDIIKYKQQQEDFIQMVNDKLAEILNF